MSVLDIKDNIEDINQTLQDPVLIQTAINDTINACVKKVKQERFLDMSSKAAPQGILIYIPMIEYKKIKDKACNVYRTPTNAYMCHINYDGNWTAGHGKVYSLEDLRNTLQKALPNYVKLMSNKLDLSAVVEFGDDYIYLPVPYGIHVRQQISEFDY